MGIKSISCSSIEKKNYNHVSYFFRKIIKDDEKKKFQLLAIIEILQHENRTLFYNHNNTPLNYQNSKKFALKLKEM